MLKVNEISGYYEGEDGVFYDVKHDEIFVLEHTGIEIYDMKKNKTVGKFYAYQTVGYKTNKTAMAGLNNTIRLGDL